MSEPTACARARSRPVSAYCDRCDLLVGLDGFHVIEVVEQCGRVQVVVESAPEPMGCRACGVLVGSHGRRDVVLIDVPCFGRPVRLVWRKRTWRCAETGCTGKAFTEQHERLARPRGLLTTRAAWWAVGQLRREHASVAGIARQLGTTWRTVWLSVDDVRGLPFGHDDIVRRAAADMRRHYRERPDPDGLLDEPFTIRELHRLHEAVEGGLGFSPDTFRRTMLPLLEETRRRSEGTVGKPAQLYVRR